MGYQVSHKRMKAKYNAEPTAREKQFHLWLMDAFPCVCGCGKQATEVHHPLERHPAQRWRRDHEYVVPIFWLCHRAIHAKGSDQLAGKAWQYRTFGLDNGYLEGAE